MKAEIKKTEDKLSELKKLIELQKRTELGKRLKKLREFQGLSVYAVAKNAITKNQVNDKDKDKEINTLVSIFQPIENGSKNYTIDSLLKYLDGVAFDIFFGELEETGYGIAPARKYIVNSTRGTTRFETLESTNEEPERLVSIEEAEQLYEQELEALNMRYTSIDNLDYALTVAEIETKAVYCAIYLSEKINSFKKAKQKILKKSNLFIAEADIRKKDDIQYCVETISPNRKHHNPQIFKKRNEATAAYGAELKLLELFCVRTNSIGRELTTTELTHTMQIVLFKVTNSNPEARKLSDLYITKSYAKRITNDPTILTESQIFDFVRAECHANKKMVIVSSILGLIAEPMIPVAMTAFLNDLSEMTFIGIIDPIDCQDIITSKHFRHDCEIYRFSLIESGGKETYYDIMTHN